MSHRIRGTHRTVWQRKPPTDRHRCAQIRRVWHPAIPTPPSKGVQLSPAAPTEQSCPPTEFTEFTEASGRGYSPTDFTDAHRSFWLRIFSHGFHRCPQIFRLRFCLLICAHPCNLWEALLRQKLLWVLWEDILAVAWVWQGCHTLLICAHLCNLWENILRQKLLWVLWEDGLVSAWVWQGCHTLL